MKKLVHFFALLLCFWILTGLIFDGHFSFSFKNTDIRAPQVIQYEGEKAQKIKTPFTNVPKGEKSSSLVSFNKGLQNCRGEFGAVFNELMEGTAGLFIDNTQANLILEELERFDFKDGEFKKAHQLTNKDLSPCSSDERVTLVGQLLLKKNLQSWDEETLDKIRVSLMRLILKTASLPLPLKDLENLIVQIEIMSEQNLFEGIYTKKIRQLRIDFERLREEFEIRTFSLAEEEKGPIDLNIGPFREKLKSLCQSVIFDFTPS
jgi:hypothetical protein